ncbi:hypothetical protein AMECASPLE_022304 [Ameca splendens]|uniref:Uncharacterized protein n=1 Tax=Ameca splendens TaxID=208324 RepID=A0ABV0Z2L6_9TELE
MYPCYICASLSRGRCSSGHTQTVVIPLISAIFQYSSTLFPSSYLAFGICSSFTMGCHSSSHSWHLRLRSHSRKKKKDKVDRQKRKGGSLGVKFWIKTGKERSQKGRKLKILILVADSSISALDGSGGKVSEMSVNSDLRKSQLPILMLSCSV